MNRVALTAVILIGCLLAPFVANSAPSARAQEATPAADCPATTPEDNADLVLRYTEGTWDQGTAELEDFVAGDMVYHWVGGTEGFETWQAAFPDRTTSAEQLAAEGDLVAMRWTATGTHQGDFFGVAPTGNSAEWTGNSILRIECGKIAEVWVQLDLVGLYRQLGVEIGPTPQDAPATPAATQEAALVASPATECPETTPEANEALISRWYDEVWSQGNYDAIGDMIATGHVHDRVVDLPAMGVAQYEANARRWRTSFPDLTFTPVELVAAGDLVAARWVASGTHQGDYYSIPASGNAVEWNGITIFQFACGRIAGSWTEADTIDFYRQVDVEIPENVASG